MLIGNDRSQARASKGPLHTINARIRAWSVAGDSQFTGGPWRRRQIPCCLGGPEADMHLASVARIGEEIGARTVIAIENEKNHF